MPTDQDAAWAVDNGSAVADYGILFRRFWAVIAIAGLLGMTAGVLFARARSSTYTSTTTVLVTDTGVAVGDPLGTSTPADINLDTEAQIVKSGAVAERAKQLLDVGGSAHDLTAHVWVRVPPNSGVLLIDYQSNARDAAQAGSTAFAEAYLANRSAAADTVLEGQSAKLEDSIAALRKNLDSAVRKQQAALDPSDRQLAEAEVRRLNGELRHASQTLANLQLINVTPGSVISDATPPRSNRATLDLVWAVGGGVVGLVLGIFLAIALDRRAWGRVRPRDLRRHPGLSAVSVRGSLTDPHSVASVSRLRSGLWKRASSPLEGVLVAGVSHEGPAALLALRLAQSVAEETDGTVAFVSRDAGVGRVLSAHGAPAVVTAEQGTVAMAPLSQDDDRLVLVVPESSGDRIPRGAAAALAWVAQRVDTAVVHAPNVRASHDAQDLAAHADATVLVVVERRTRRKDLRDAVDQMQEVDAQRLTVVLLGHRAADRDRRAPTRRRGRQSRAPSTAPITAPIQSAGVGSTTASSEERIADAEDAAGAAAGR